MILGALHTLLETCRCRSRGDIVPAVLSHRCSSSGNTLSGSTLLICVAMRGSLTMGSYREAFTRPDA